MARLWDGPSELHHFRGRQHQDLAKDFLNDAIVAQGIDEHQLTIHADRGGAMRSKPVSQLMQDLHIRRSHSRPHVSNDNPFSEAQFKTLKYCPVFPERFESIEQARAFCQVFFAHYNHEHRHSGIALHTPASVHYGTHHEVRVQRQETLDAAFEKNPLRFRHRAPRAPELASVVWINKPAEQEVAQISKTESVSFDLTGSGARQRSEFEGRRSGDQKPHP